MAPDSLIATTQEIESRRKQLEDEGVFSKSFKPNSIDYRKHISKYQVGGVTIDDPIKCMDHLFQESFNNRQVVWMQDKLQTDHFHRHRFLIEIPEGYTKVDQVRNAWLNIQQMANSPELYVPTSSSDTFQLIKRFSEIYVADKPVNLVLNDKIALGELNKILQWAIPRFNEIIIMHSDWSKNKPNYSLFLLYANMHPNKFHLYGAHWNLNKFENDAPLAVLAMCYNFKSVSFKDLPFPAYLIKRITSAKKSKTLRTKIKESVWLNSETLEYQKEHPEECECLADNSRDILDLATRSGLKSCQTLHLVEKFSELFELIRQDEEERNRVFELESMSKLVKILIVGE